MFVPQKIYYEPNVTNYELGKRLIEKYSSMNIPMQQIENHNNILELRQKQNSEFSKLKQLLILGVRKTHKYVPNHKVSNYLVPYTSSGCSAMCLYCYLVCHYNKCAYLRLFVNREQMLKKIIDTVNKSNEELVFEIGSNSDLVLENTITGNLEWTIEEFGKNNKGYITLPTKFDMIDNLLNLKHNGRTIIRMSVNPQYIISKVELGTSSLLNRIEAVNKLYKAGYRIGILIAPVIMVDNWKQLYLELIETLYNNLDVDVRKNIFFEVIFMTYSYVHSRINEEAFPNAIKIYDKDIMTGRGKGKYMYKKELRNDGELFIRSALSKYFSDNDIIYIV